MSGKTISREDYYKLHGLLAIAKRLNSELDTATRAAAELTGEADDGYGYFGHTSDAMIGQDLFDPDPLLRKLGISVAASREGQES